MVPSPIAEVDAALARAKGPLRECRVRYLVNGDVTYRLRYAPSGEVYSVTIDYGPPGMSPEFINASTMTIKSMVSFPRTGTGGEMLFTDHVFAPGMAPPSAAAINAQADQQTAIAKLLDAKHRNRNFLIVAIVIVVAIAIGANVKSDKDKCIDRGIAYFKDIGSWPTLSSGRDAETVAQERCSRTTGAF